MPGGPQAAVSALGPVKVLQYVLQFDPRIGGISCRLMSDRVASQPAAHRSKPLKRWGKR